MKDSVQAKIEPVEEQEDSQDARSFAEDDVDSDECDSKYVPQSLQ